MVIDALNVSWIFLFIAFFQLSFFLYFHNRRSRANKLFAAFLVILTYWSGLGVLVVGLKIVPSFYIILLMPVFAFSGVVFLLFVRALSGVRNLFTRPIVAFSILGLVFSAYTAYMLIHPGARADLIRGTTIQGHTILRAYATELPYRLYLAYIIIPLLVGIVELLLGYRKESDILNRSRMRAVLFFVGVGSSGSLVAFSVLPLMGFRPDSLWGSFFIAFIVAGTSYSLMRHRSWRTEHLLDVIEEKEAQLRERNRIIEKEFDLARIIHARLLPQSIPQNPNLDLHVLYLPMERVGGDFYDFFVEPDTIHLAIYDVSGHGVPGAFVGAMAKMILHNLLRSNGSPREIVESLNREIRPHLAPGYFITAVYVQFFPQTRDILFVSAGHPRPVLIGLRGDARELVAPGRLVGIFPELGLVEQRIHLEPGDRLVLYTDGITEALSPQHHMFGEDRFYRFLEEHRGMDGALVTSALLQEIRDHTGSQKLMDDITLLTLDVR